MIGSTIKTKRRNKPMKRKVLIGVIHIQATYNNTLLNISTIQGKTLVWSSAGACGFHGARKRTYYFSIESKRTRSKN